MNLTLSRSLARPMCPTSRFVRSPYQMPIPNLIESCHKPVRGPTPIPFQSPVPNPRPKIVPKPILDPSPNPVPNPRIPGQPWAPKPILML